MTQINYDSTAEDILHLDATQPADVLAYINYTLGFEPRESWICVGIQNNLLGPVLRADTPPDLVRMLEGPLEDFDDQILTEYATQIAKALCNDPQTGSAIMVLQLSTQRATPAEVVKTIDAKSHFIQRAFEDNAIELPDIWCVIGDQLWHVNCLCGSQCLIQPSNIESVHDTKTARLLGAVPSHRRRAEPVPELRLPDGTVSPEHYREESRRPEHFEDENELREIVEWLAEWEKILETTFPPDITSTPAGSEQSRRSGPEPQWLSRPLRYKWCRDLLLATATLGLDTALAGMQGLGGIPSTLAKLHPVPSSHEATSACEHFIVGRTDEPPRWRRLDRLFETLKELLPHATGIVPASIGSMMAWIEWARGRGSIGFSYISQVQRYAPQHSLTQLLRKIINQGHICGWATRQDQAWSAVSAQKGFR